MDPDEAAHYESTLFIDAAVFIFGASSVNINFETFACSLDALVIRFLAYLKRYTVFLVFIPLSIHLSINICLESLVQYILFANTINRPSMCDEIGPR